MGTNVEALVEAARSLELVTEAALEYASARDFEALAAAIEHRSSFIGVLKAYGDLSRLSCEARSQVLLALEKTQRVDQDIRIAMEDELALDTQAITDVAAKAKALSAYERIVPKARRFDTQK